MSDPIEKQGQALENQFFAKVDQQLIEKLRKENAAKEQMAALKEVLPISDDAVLKSLIDLGVTAEKAAALRIVPIIMVAWADGSVDESERLLVLRAAEQCSIEPGSAAGQLLDHWLRSKPPSEILDDWCSYARELFRSMQKPEGEAFKKAVLSQIKDVARVSGGILGWGAVTAGESRIIDRVEAALSE